MAATALKRRLEALEAASGGDGGCERCRGLLVTVRGVTTGEFYSASWNSEAISEEDLLERQAETKCPRCARKNDPDEAPEIKISGHR